MKNNSFFKIAFLKIWRDKRNLFFVLLFLICLTSIICIINFKLNFDNYLNETVKNDIAFRSIIVDPTQEQTEEVSALSIKYAEEGKDPNRAIKDYDYKYEILNNIKYVVDGYDFEDWNSWTEKESIDGYDNVSIAFQAATKGLGLDILDEQIKQHKRGYAVCPLKFQISREPNYYNGKDFINKKITVTYTLGVETPTEILKGEEKTKEFTIIGLYNAPFLGMEDGTCFISREDIEEINDESYYGMKAVNGAYFLVVDKRENVDYVLKEIQKLGYFPIVQEKLNTDFIAKTNMLISFLFIVSLIAIIATIIFLIKKKVMNDTFLIGLLKSFGFNEKEIKKFYTLEIIILILICLFISLILSNLVFLILIKTTFKDVVYSGINLKLYNYVYIIVGILTIFISLFINNLFLKNKINKKVIDLIKEETI